MVTALTKALEWKISQTKKRLSENYWLHVQVVISIITIIMLVNFSIKPIASKWDYGRIESHLPVVKLESNEITKNKSYITQKVYIGKNTTTLLMDYKRFIFGNLEDFSTHYIQPANKIEVPHDEGQPQMDLLFETLQVWMYQRKTAIK